MSSKIEKPLHIAALEIENILRVSAVSIKTDGSVIELTGRNRAGKSSIIDAIWIAMGGEKNIPKMPIHGDAAAGHVIVELDDEDGFVYRVTRKLRRREDGSIGTTLTLENADGKLQQPQVILSRLFGALSIDPLEFMDQDPKQQADVFKRLVPGFDFAAAEAANAKDFAERTNINRDAKAARAREAGIVIPADAPAERLDEAALIAEMQKAGEHNALIERRKAGREEAGRTIARCRASVKDLEAQADALRQQADKLDLQAVAAEGEARDLEQKLANVEPLPDQIDSATLGLMIEEARRVNALFDAGARARADKARYAEEAAAAEAKSEALTAAIDKRKADMAAAIAASEMPVEGITFEDAAVLYRGLPINQASQAEQIGISVAIAAALNPRLRFVSVKQASLLDQDSWDLLLKLSKERNLQIIAETVQSNRPTAVLIEDGMVAHQPVREAAA
jgi:hypothetical protein